MANPIPVPKLLQFNAARKLNDLMITKNKSFVFLGEPDQMINTTPLTYLEAFKEYAINLYVLYHERGMQFLECYENEATRLANDNKSFFHVRFVFDCRAVTVHADDSDDHGGRIHKQLRDYVFPRAKEPYNYNNWNDFWINAPENHWKLLVEKIVNESDRMCVFLDKIANNKTYANVSASITNIFTLTRKFTRVKGGDTDIYAGSFDHRFLEQTCRKISKITSPGYWRDAAKAELELNTFYKSFGSSHMPEPDRQNSVSMREELIKRTMNSLKKDEFEDSEALYQSIIQNIEDLINAKIERDLISEAEDMLD